MSEDNQEQEPGEWEGGTPELLEGYEKPSDDGLSDEAKANIAAEEKADPAA